ncbi:hypothetical protein [Aquabacterium sp.]|uniref:hypothetical protein n=1 Tax=Aquabacterium sp. TaxID=1872578 RepID=UPI0024874E24|nr:hypothetical protein [Aquabacterium sp.]MDI1259388.1 hypothetical protein [Aquabacterium sp.]
MALYPEALVRVLWPFWFGATGSWWRKKPEGELVAMLQQQALYGKVYFLVIRALLSFLGMRRLLLLDDPRNVGVYCHAARALGIPTTGYMHGKFNVYHVGLVASPFDVYLVWSPYFGAKIASMWGERYPGKVVVCGLIRDALFIPAREALPDNVLRVLWLDEDGVPLSEIRPYIEKLKGMSHVKVLFRPKPRAAAAHASFPDWYLSAFPHDGQVSFLQSLAHHHVDAVIGCHSTALLEAAMLGVAPVAVITSFDYARDLGEDGVVFPCGSPEQMFAQLEALAASPSHSPPSDWPTLKLAIEPFQPRVAQQELSDQGFVLDAAVLHTGHTACQS